MSDSIFDVLLFIGHFHPVIVHFPIALLVLAGLLEVGAALHRPWRAFHKAATFVLVLGAVSAATAVAAGYLLSLEGGYEETQLSRHKWLGISVMSAAATATLLKLRTRRRASRIHRRAYGGALVVTVVAVTLAGHEGGSLTHGRGYLTHYLPDALKERLGVAVVHAPLITDIDSAYVYRDLIVPVFQARCVSCHGESKEKGGLRLDTPDGLLQGGDGGAVIVARDPEESELLQRITLSPSQDEAMPPDGAQPLDVGETELIRWWIVHGASMEHRVGDIDEMPTSVATLLDRIAPRAEQKTGLYALEAEPADPEAVKALRNAGFGIGPVARDLDLLQVTAVNLRSELRADELNLLAPVAAQIAWLDLGHTPVADAGLEVLARMTNLTRLSLAQTAVGDDGLRHLSELENLEYLNLFGSRVSDAGLDHLAHLDRLKALYLWQTDVTDDGVKRIEQSHPELNVVLGTTPAPDSAERPALP